MKTKGIIRYNTNGKPICEICNKAFDRVLCHARQVHKISASEYKTQFGLDKRKGICSKKSKELSQEAVMINYDKVVKSNLIQKGEKARYKKGSKGRTKDMVSTQTKIRLKKHIKSLLTDDELRESGKILGKSGLGNKARWNKTTKGTIK